jgi:cytochrome P450
MDPVLIQRILLEEAESYSKQPLNDDVFGEAIGGGLLNAEGEEWRWQRRLAAPLFRAEEMLRYVPAFAAASAPLLKRWNDSGAGAAQRIDRDMTGATLQALQDTVLGAGLGDDDRRAIQDAGANFADIEGVGVSRIDRERVHLTAYDIIVGEKSAERPDGIPPFRTSSRTENAESKGNAN